MTQYPIESDKRYTINHEYTGHASGHPVHVLRWCGDFIASSPFLSPMIVRAVGHKAAREKGIIEGRPA